jgi:hypothetical protein
MAELKHPIPNMFHMQQIHTCLGNIDSWLLSQETIDSTVHNNTNEILKIILSYNFIPLSITLTSTAPVFLKKKQFFFITIYRTPLKVIISCSTSDFQLLKGQFTSHIKK